MNGHDIESIKDLFEQYKQHSDEWRNSMNVRMDKLFEKFEQLPCRERAVQTINHEKEHERLWDWGVKLLWGSGIIPLWGAIIYLIDRLHKK